MADPTLAAQTVNNPWWNPAIGGPHKIHGKPQSITGIDALDGLLRGWFAVEGFKTAQHLAKSGATQAAERTTVERQSQVGREPVNIHGAPVQAGVVSSDMLVLMGLGLLLFLAVK